MTQESAHLSHFKSVDGISARSIAAMVLLAVLWGLSIPATKLGLVDLPPMTLTAVRFIVAVPVLMILAIGKLRVPMRAIPSLAGLGAMGIIMGNVAQSYGVSGLSASAATIISSTIPLFIVIFAAFRLKQQVTVRQWAGLLAAFSGIALVAVGSGPETANATSSTLTGVAWMLVSAIAIAYYYIWSAELSQQYGTMAVTAWNALAGLVAIIPFAAWEMSSEPVHLTSQVMWIAVYLGVLVTGVGILLWMYLLRRVPARIAASVQYFQPVIGIAASAALFGDQLGLLFFAGVVLILGGLALTVATKKS